MSERNPIYQTFLRSGFMGQLEDRFRRAGEHSALFRTVSSERRAVMSMWKRGVIGYDEYVSLTAKISRALHARILRDAMRGVSLPHRRRTIAEFRKIAPAGMSSYNCRMGAELLMQLIAEYLPWLLSAITIYMTILAGNRSRHAWLLGLVNQGLWLIWIISTASWGLIPMNLALWVVYARNHLKWTASNKAL